MLIRFSNDPERPVNDNLASVFREAQSLVTGILEISPSASSDPIVRTLNFEGIEAVQHLAIPGEPREVSSVIPEALSIFDNRMRLDHPSCFGYIPSCPSPLAHLGDLLTSIFNVNAAMWNISSGPSVVENSLIQWLASQVGLPSSSSGGCFVSGGSMANLTSIIAARDNMLPQKRRSDAIIYMSEQTHISIAKSLHIAGFCDYQIRVIPTDHKFRLNCEAIRQSIVTDRCNGRLPFLIVASCGTTNTGSIDPLHTLADIARDEGMWFHVDGAYGASIALSSTHRHLVDGLGRADSISWDGHKWLFQTYGCGIVLVRNAKTLKDSFKVDADYIRSLSPDGITNFYNLSPELSRPSRAMSLWFTLRVLGDRPIGEMIDHGFSLALAAEHEVRQLTNWEIVSPATASIVVFRYTPPGLDDRETDSLNSEISARLLAENTAAILTTKIRNRTVLRLCAINPAVQSETITRIIKRMGWIATAEFALKFPGKEMRVVPNSLCAEGCEPVKLEQNGA